MISYFLIKSTNSIEHIEIRRYQQIYEIYSKPQNPKTPWNLNELNIYNN